MVVFTFLLTIPFILLSLIIPNWITRMMEEQIQDSTIEKMDQYSFYINSITTQAEEVARQVLVNQTTQTWMKLEKEDVESQENERLLMKNQLKKQLSSIMINNSNGISLSVYMDNGREIWWDSLSSKQMSWYKQYSQKDQMWIKAHFDPFQQTPEMGKQYVNSYLQPLFDLYTFERYGFIKVNYPTSLFTQALNNITLGENGRVYLLNQQGENILTGKVQTPKKILQQSLEKIKKDQHLNGLIHKEYDGEEYLVFFQKLRVDNWILVSEVTKSELFSKVNELRRNLLITSLLLFGLTNFAAYRLSSNIVSPLGKLTRAMKLVEHGKFEKAKQMMPTIQSENHEISYVIKVFDHMIDQLNYLIETEYEANIRRKNAEYKALLLQINPHFLNNTLEIIGGLAAQGKNKEVMDVSVYLARMMRYSMNTKSDIVSMDDEINYIRNYTDILKARYEDNLSILIDEDQKMKPIPIIKFILQPLVENAVKYSFEGKKVANIKVITKMMEDQMVIVVEDHGVGMSEEVIAELMSQEQHNESSYILASNGNSIGLRNVLGRLQLYYGSQFSFDIQSEEWEGTKITLRVKLDGGMHDEGDDH